MGYRLKKSVSVQSVAQAMGFQMEGPDLEIEGVCAAHESRNGYLSFCSDVSGTAKKAVVICPEDQKARRESRTALYTENAKLGFIRTLDFLESEIGFSTFQGPPKIASTARIGSNVAIGDGCEIGEHVVIEANCVIHSGTRIGAHSRIRSNASIGSDGFGFERLEDQTPIRFVHLGGVRIGEHVEIGACTAVARGTLQDTIIEDHAKIDNLVHVAHNCVIRKGAFVIAGTILSGSVQVGENAWIAPNSSIRQKLEIGPQSLVGLGAVVTKPVEAGTIVAGNPARVLKKKA